MSTKQNSMNFFSWNLTSGITLDDKQKPPMLLVLTLPGTGSISPQTSTFSELNPISSSASLRAVWDRSESVASALPPGKLSTKMNIVNRAENLSVGAARMMSLGTLQIEVKLNATGQMHGFSISTEQLQYFAIVTHLCMYAFYTWTNMHTRTHARTHAHTQTHKTRLPTQYYIYRYFAHMYITVIDFPTWFLPCVRTAGLISPWTEWKACRRQNTTVQAPLPSQRSHSSPAARTYALAPRSVA